MIDEERQPGVNRSKIVLKLMADHECLPLWRPSASGAENVDPATLPISSELVERLRAWSRAYDATVDRDDPRRSDFESDEQASAFVDEGAALRRDLERELGNGYRVISHREGQGLEPEDAAAWEAAWQDRDLDR
jgi:hypothetical protein